MLKAVTCVMCLSYCYNLMGQNLAYNDLSSLTLSQLALFYVKIMKNLYWLVMILLKLVSYMLILF